VRLVQGEAEGTVDDGVRLFYGLPFAEPPVGDLRWRAPVPASSWAGTLDATGAPPVCPQVIPILESETGQEDCLYLSVHAPVEATPTDPRPVMVWVHGGGFAVGNGLQNDGSRLAREDDVVVVNINYRLGQLGFLAHSALGAESPDEASGNYGLMDQTAALRWVRGNIAEFGGDPENVTIFGESAGAFSVCSHLASVQSDGLFHKAILQSGSCERPWPTLPAAEAQGDAFASALECDAEADVLGCMRAKSADQVLAALPPAPNFGFAPSDGATGSWGPVFDGSFFTEQPSEAFASGRFNQVPTIIGFTREEARLFVWLGEISDPPLEVTADNYVELIAHFLGGDAELAARAANEYPLEDYSEPAVALAAVATDTVFRCPGKEEAAKLAARVPTYLYQFEFPDGHSQLEVALPFIDAAPPSYPLAAFHGADIPYVFGYDPLLEINFEDFSTVLKPWAPGTSDEALWLDVLGYFSRFAATGNPNADDGVQWPEVDAELDQHLVFDASVSIGTHAADKCAFWEGEDYLVPELRD
jgi:para-nitrobenzyl esterase